MKIFIVVCLMAVSSAQPYGGKQNPKAWAALRILRGGKDITTEEQQNILINAVPGKDFPLNAVIPSSLEVDCSSFAQPGFYADTSDISRCQIFHRCDINQVLTSYLCPNETLFNQITLVCDWFFNVDCSQSTLFNDYSNSRLYQETALFLDNDLTPARVSNTGAPGGEWVYVTIPPSK